MKNNRINLNVRQMRDKGEEAGVGRVIRRLDIHLEADTTCQNLDGGILQNTSALDSALRS
jgi:hypothetical protein